MWPRAIAMLRPQVDRGGPTAVALLGYALAAGLGELDQAFAWLDRAIVDGSVIDDDTEVLFDALHPDPRFARVRARFDVPTP